MKLLITGPFDDKVLSSLQEQGFDVLRRSSNATEEELEDAIAQADAYVLGGNEMLTPEMPAQAPRLRMVVFMGEQPETFMAEGTEEMLKDRGIVLESTPGVSTNAVAEMACALLLSTLRRAPFLAQSTQRHEWPEYTGGELAGKTLGIYGAGKIGYTVVKRLQGFDLNQVLYTDVVQSERTEKDFGVLRVDLDRLFSESDAVSLHAPLTPETRGVVNRDALVKMRPNAVLVNTARAELVDPDDLRMALQEGWLAGAAFDGYYKEGRRFVEMPHNGDLYGLLSLQDRFFVTTHQGFNTREAIRNASEAASEKLTSFFTEARAA